MSASLVNVTAAIIRKNGKILVAKRGAAGFLAGYWEFPGGKIEGGEDLVSCLKREIREELGIDIIVEKPFHTARYDYGEKGVVCLHSFLCDITEGEPKAGHSHSEIAWTTVPELNKYYFAPADISIVKRLLRGKLLS